MLNINSLHCELEKYIRGLLWIERIDPEIIYWILNILMKTYYYKRLSSFILKKNFKSQLQIIHN